MYCELCAIRSWQVNAQLAKRANERPWHCALPTLVAAVALGSLPLFMGRNAWVAFLALSVATAGIWSSCGPLMSWPAGILSGTNAASGNPPAIGCSHSQNQDTHVL